MNKITNLLLVRRPDLENKWWHRLANVLVYGSTILVAIFVISLFVSDSGSWKKYSYTAFNFENTYSTAQGHEISCRYNDHPPRVFCGGHPSEVYDFIKRYNQVIKDELGAETVKAVCTDTVGRPLLPTTSVHLTQEEEACLHLTLDLAPISSADFLLINNEPHGYSNEQRNFIKEQEFRYLTGGLKVKSVTSVIYPILFKNLFYVILSIVGWFIFWESVVYRALVYIILGKKK